jgi:hypothetical protein
LSKLQSGLWQKSNDSSESFTLSDIDDDVIESLMNKDVESVSSGKKTYKL